MKKVLKENYNEILEIIMEKRKEENIQEEKKENEKSKVTEYYDGEYSNNKRHGKGIIYRNNKIIYNGDFIDDKFEGNGKLLYNNGDYYIGSFIKGLKDGKGIEYYQNNTIKYDGDFSKDKYNGDGILSYKDGRSVSYTEGRNEKGPIARNIHLLAVEWAFRS